jgi:hypothetical protein
VFAHSAPTDPLTQGDVIEDCPLVGLNLAVLPLNLNDPATKWWTASVIVLTQACDLAQAKVESVLSLFDAGVLKGTVIRDHMRRHLVFGWYFLPAAPAPVSLPESLIDLRDVHSVPRVVLEELIKGGKRLANLVSPYREHLAQHFAVTYMRVALPEPYATQPQ